MNTQWSPDLQNYLRAEYIADLQRGYLIHKRDNGKYWSAGDIQIGWKHKSKASPYHYITVFINGKKKNVKVHHVLWFLHYGKQPEGVIDHIRGLDIPYPNAMSNLRETTHANNLLNSSKANGKTKIRGVHALRSGGYKVVVYQKSVARCDSKWEGYSLYCEHARKALESYYRPQLNPCGIWMVKPSHPDYKKFVLGVS
ncbi:hypothetical protein ACEU59_07510 [Buttiauxella noackiae]|uniref:hypothetical protein n=1 Tax=Buttiauxella noackiae TaxID=82992 RepID=UPI0035A6AA39